VIREGQTDTGTVVVPVELSVFIDPGPVTLSVADSVSVVPSNEILV
jgi:hypothetical protein